jgi:signal transduction histidine kinase/ActR/RegA family two-component response regulator
MGAPLHLPALPAELLAAQDPARWREALLACGELLDGLDIALCAFDEDDRAVCWNRAFPKMFPEHAGRLQVGEHYSHNLRRFYRQRLQGDELAHIDEFIAAAVRRHHTQDRPFSFEHHGRRVHAWCLHSPGLGRVRVWRADEALPPGTQPPPALAGARVPASALQLLDMVPDGLMICGPDGIVQWVNERFLQLLALADAGAARGRSFDVIYRGAWLRTVEDMPPEGLTVLREALRFAGAPFELPLPGGRCCRMAARRAPDGSVVYTLADISALKQVERELQGARDAAESANRIKSQFLAHMSHELRTPMNAVMGLAQVLQQQVAEPRQSELLRRILEAGQSLLGILNDILDLSKIEAGQLLLEQQPYALGEVLARVDSLLRPSAQSKGLRLAIEPLPPLPARLQGDPLRIGQVLVNLVGNAIKFTAAGSVRLEVVRETAGGAERLRFAVHDTGVGIAPEALGRLFTPFTQADSSVTRRYGGTGLGLAISKRLVECMGGGIGAHSRPGLGSSFWFTLPLLAAAEPKATAAPVAPAVADDGRELAGLRVLVADDVEVNLLVAEQMLVSRGAEVATAGDGHEALQVLAGAPEGYDVVLMDVQMPGLDGLSATRAIRADRRLARLGVVALTAGVTRAEQESAHAAGVDAILPKPLDLRALVAVLQRWAPAAGAAALPAA